MTLHSSGGVPPAAWQGPDKYKSQHPNSNSQIQPEMPSTMALKQDATNTEIRISLALGAPVRLQLRCIPPRGNEAAFSYKSLAYPCTEFHGSDIEPSRAAPPSGFVRRPHPGHFEFTLNFHKKTAKTGDSEPVRNSHHTMCAAQLLHAAQPVTIDRNHRSRSPEYAVAKSLTGSAPAQALYRAFCNYDQSGLTSHASSQK